MCNVTMRNYAKRIVAFNERSVLSNCIRVVMFCNYKPIYTFLIPFIERGREMLFGG